MIYRCYTGLFCLPLKLKHSYSSHACLSTVFNIETLCGWLGDWKESDVLHMKDLLTKYFSFAQLSARAEILILCSDSHSFLLAWQMLSLFKFSYSWAHWKVYHIHIMHLISAPLYLLDRLNMKPLCLTVRIHKLSPSLKPEESFGCMLKCFPLPQHNKTY